MADTASIDELIAKSAQKVDFSPIGNYASDYYKGAEDKSKKDLRDAFKGGVPTKEDGSIDYEAMSRKLYQLGDIDKGTSLANTDISRQQLRLGQDVSQGLGALENGGATPIPNMPIVSPSTSRALPPPGQVGQPAPVNGGPVPQQGAPQGGAQQPIPVRTTSVTPNGGYKGGDNGNSIVGLVSSRIPQELAGPLISQIAAQAGVDPNAPLSDPAVRAKVLPIAQRVLGQYTQGQQGPNPQPPQSQQPPAFIGQPGGPPGIPAPNRGAMPTGIDPEIQKQIARLTQIVSNPALPEATRGAAKIRLEALQKNAEFTNTQKDYDQARRQGFTGTQQQFEADKSMAESRGKAQGEAFSKKYDAAIEGGNRALQEIPQIDLTLKAMQDPDFYSGIGSKYNLILKKAIVALGGDPNSGVPQQVFQKVVSGNILNSLGQLKGLGQIRVAEINLAKEAAASSENTPAANKVLLTVSKRLHQRASDIADMAQNYNGGNLDSGFDRKVSDYDKDHPLFSPKEIENFRSVIAPQKVGITQEDYAKLGKGETYTAPDGSQRIKR